MMKTYSHLINTAFYSPFPLLCHFEMSHSLSFNFEILELSYTYNQ
jgi:hypothetical protein